MFATLRPMSMTPLDKQELQKLKASLLHLEMIPASVIAQILSEINLSLNFKSIILHRHVNELFLYVNTNKTIEYEHLLGFKNNLMTQINSAIGNC